MAGEFVELEIPVAWGDMDAFGHVNNVVYLRWFESGRIRFFEHLQIPHRDVGQTAAPILARATCDFQRPLTYPDTVHVHTTVARIGTKSFTMNYRIDSAAQSATAARGDGVVVWYDYAAESAIPLPDHLRARLARYQE